jgi:hypothetical protein
MATMMTHRHALGASELEWVPLGKSVPYKSGYDQCTQLTTVVDGRHPIYGVRRVYGGYASNYLDNSNILFSPTPVATPTNNTSLAIAYGHYFGEAVPLLNRRATLNDAFTQKNHGQLPFRYEFLCEMPIYLLYVQKGMTDYEAFEILIERETYRSRTPYTYNY